MKRRIWLRDSGTKAIRTAKAMGKRAVRSEVNHALEKKGLEVPANPLKQAQQERRPQKDRSPVQTRCVENPNSKICCATRSAYARNGERNCSGVGCAYAKCGNHKKRAYSTHRYR